MTEQEGIEEINKAVWTMDEHNYLNLYVHDEHGHKIWAYLSLRPVYCDRGHIQLNIDGPIGLDGADSFPRFFFTEKEAKEHTRVFLLWRIWKHRVHPHQLNNQS